MNTRAMAAFVALVLTVACQIAMAHVVELDTTNFGLTSNGSSWMLEFYAPWSVPVALPYLGLARGHDSVLRRCGHCKTLAPEYTKAANSLQGRVSFGKVDGERSVVVASWILAPI